MFLVYVCLICLPTVQSIAMPHSIICQKWQMLLTFCHKISNFVKTLCHNEANLPNFSNIATFYPLG